MKLLRTWWKSKIYYHIVMALFLIQTNTVYASRFNPPANNKEINEIKEKATGEELLKLLNIHEGRSDYLGRRFTAINKAKTHFILQSSLFKEGFALYKTPPIDTSPIKLQNDGIKTLFGKHIFLGKEQADSVPRLLHEIGTLNDVKGFVAIKNKRDAIEYVRMASSGLTGYYFSTRMEELFCVEKPDRRGEAEMKTFEECAALGLKTPTVKKIKRPKIKIESDTTKTKFKLTSKSVETEDVGEDEEDDKKAQDTNVQAFLVTRNVVIQFPPDFEAGIYRVTEEVGLNGEWRIVEKKLIKSFQK